MFDKNFIDKLKETAQIAKEVGMCNEDVANLIKIFSEPVVEVESSLNEENIWFEVAELLKITRQAYTHYESGERNPSIDTLCLLADYYGVTLDYIVGRTDIPNIYRVTKVKDYEDQLIKDKAKELLLEMIGKI